MSVSSTSTVMESGPADTNFEKCDPDLKTEPSSHLSPDKREIRGISRKEFSQRIQYLIGKVGMYADNLYMYALYETQFNRSWLYSPNHFIFIPEIDNLNQKLDQMVESIRQRRDRSRSCSPTPQYNSRNFLDV